MSARGIFNTISTAALGNLQAIATAAMTKADAASTTAATASSTAAGAAVTVGQLASAQNTADQVHASLQAQIDALKTAGTMTRLATASAATPVLALNATADITFTLSRTMPTSTYNTELVLPTALLGKLTPTVKSRTPTGLVITIKAGVAITGDSITVIAWQ